MDVGVLIDCQVRVGTLKGIFGVTGVGRTRISKKKKNFFLVVKFGWARFSKGDWQKKYVKDWRKSVSRVSSRCSIRKRNVQGDGVGRTKVGETKKFFFLVVKFRWVGFSKDGRQTKYGKDGCRSVNRVSSPGHIHKINVKSDGVGRTKVGETKIFFVLVVKFRWVGLVKEVGKKKYVKDGCRSVNRLSSPCRHIERNIRSDGGGSDKNQ